MVDDAAVGEQLKDFARETFQLCRDLERMIEQMENISVKLTWMAYDMAVLRTDPQLAKSLKMLENEFARCKTMDKMEKCSDIVLFASTVDLDYIMMQLDAISQTLDQLEVKTQLLQANLTVCFTHPNKVPCLHSGPEDTTGLIS